MIRYTLKCTAGHGFDSWFQSGAALDRLLTAGQVTCPDCGVALVEKALMAPALGATLRDAPRNRDTADRETALAALKAEVEAKSEYVGVNFVAEARAMHDGDKPERSIYGEAKPEQAIKLLEDGIPIMPLPFMPVRKVN